MIGKWLQLFRDSWQNHEVDKLMELFAEDVEYWETPFQKLDSLQHVRNEWAAIEKQSDIILSTSIYSSSPPSFVIKWDLTYTNDLRSKKHWAGLYLIELNDNGKCTYFYQVGEELPSDNS